MLWFFLLAAAYAATAQTEPRAGAVPALLVDFPFLTHPDAKVRFFRKLFPFIFY